MDTVATNAFAQGWLMMAGLIVAVGAQNAFVLRQGLAQRHVGAVVMLCSASDALLIALGVFGMGTALSEAPLLRDLLRWAGALFVATYALRSGLRALRGGAVLAATSAARTGMAATVASTLALTYLNPHVYLDTIVLLGTVGAQQAGSARASFAAGAALASAMWFAALGYGASAVSPWLKRPAAWRAIDAGVAVVMAWVALQLVFQS
jgi:L-lysine exporter family protein LysE/ArgO